MKKITLLAFLFITFISVAQIPAGYYDYATGSGFTLKTQLKEIIDNVNDASITVNEYIQAPKSYDNLWTLYRTSDDRPNPNYPATEPNETFLWEMYSDCDFIFGTVASGGHQDDGLGGGTECNKYNREHSFPKSWWGGSTGLNIHNDPFHVIPSDKKVNNIRGNLAFSEVAVANYTSANGSKRGTSSISGPIGDVFEPANQYKGDIARGLLYVAVRYQDDIASWENNNPGGDNMLDGSSDKVFEQWALDMLYSWHLADPVSPKEINRNETIYGSQNNRNPFIDHPEWVNEIWGSVLAVEDYVASDFNIHPNPTYSSTVYINKGNNTIKLLELYSISGKLILSKKIDSQHSVITLDNLDKVAAGMYLLKIHTDKNSVIKKLVIN
jgi:endonuclease I